ncbi:UDP-Glycosyltransferase/glycogen phosphorylase [Microthyrium microscopicum]|uniref:UDP-Glycosyltransferase/glycogen phosphorylase n=1 Tax=Microthyrium microscopicum TaxID=703497 RepID=A0A6A6TU23_9PEZI|nr:UDP-Glycosyltransferase/glycogen phosphorylase [Microthyrium microscopicum]
MRVAVITQLTFPIRQPYPGGVEMNTHLLVKTFQSLGHDVVLYAAASSDTSFNVVEVTAPLRYMPGGVATCVMGTTEQNTAARAHRDAMYEKVMELIQDGKFVIIHSNSVQAIPLRRCAENGVPTVSVLHCMPLRPQLNAYTAAVRDTAIVKQIRFIGVSYAAVDLWSGVLRGAGVVLSIIDLESFVYKHKIRSGVKFAFWAGRINPIYWQAEIEHLLGPDVVDLGHLDSRQLSTWYVKASVLIISSHADETFGFIVVEALVGATPVAAFRTGVVPTLIEGTCGRVVEKRDAEHLALALQECLSLSQNLVAAYDNLLETLLEDREMSL